MHTPGPWKAVGTNVFFVVDAGVIELGHLHPENVKDNVNLIAAAPELLESLECIEERADEKMGEWAPVAFAYLPEDMETLYELREEARRAIAKAKGETP